MNYIDCHNHLLPGVDDGAKSMKESLDSLCILRSQGVTSAILTPHVNSPYVKCTLTIEQLRERFLELKKVCEKEPGSYPALSLGSEYYFDPVIENSMDPITMAGSDIVMLELPYEIDLGGVNRAVEAARGQGFRVLLAHPEKYDAFKYQWDEALLFLQSSPDIFVQLESWDVGKHDPYSWRFIESRTATVIGTDSHGYHREPSYDKAVAALTEWALGGSERREYMDQILRKNAQHIMKLTENTQSV